VKRGLVLAVVLGVASGLVLGTADLLLAAEQRYEVKPYVSVTEQYTSNVFLTNTNTKEDWITTVTPGIRLGVNDPSFGADVDLNAGYNWYANRTKEDYWSVGGNINLRYNPDPLLTFRLREYALRTSQSSEPSYQAGQAGNVQGTYQGTTPYWRNILEPSVDWKFSKQGSLGLLYRNNILRYEGGSAYSDSTENYFSPRLTWMFDQRNSITLDYAYTIGDFQSQPDFIGNNAHARYTYRYDAQMSFFVDYEFFNRVYDAPGTSYTVSAPTAGVEYAFDKSLIGLAQIGYYWQNPNGAEGKNGPKGILSLTQKDKLTTYTLSLEAGYKEDVFSTQNLGFSRYDRALAVVNHMLTQRFSVGLVGVAEHSDYAFDPRIDWVYTADATASYALLKWLSISGRAGWQQRDSNISVYDYNEFHAYVTLSATYE
jgi:hypothetical protein